MKGMSTFVLVTCLLYTFDVIPIGYTGAFNMPLENEV